jgi:pyridoxine kinase
LKILSIQSWVASGHVGNAAAIFPLQRLGAEVVAIHTVQFSNHPGHGQFTGHAFPASDTASLLAGLSAHGALADCDALLSGYLGEAALGPVLVDAASRVRAANRAALWCCDPVMGDDGRLYVQPEIPGFFAAHAVPQADLLVPNQFELATLTGAEITSLAAAKAAAGALRERMRPHGPRAVLVTSLKVDESAPGSAEQLLACDAGTFRIRTDLLPAKFSGAGDLVAALFLFHVLRSGDLTGAAVAAASSLAGVLRHTWQAGMAELALVQAQNEFSSPTNSAGIEGC